MHNLRSFLFSEKTKNDLEADVTVILLTQVKQYSWILPSSTLKSVNICKE